MIAIEILICLGLLPKGAFIQGQDSIYLTDGKSVVLAEEKGVPALSVRYVTANPFTECAYFPNSKVLVIINNSKETQRTSVSTEFGTIRAELEGFGTRMIELQSVSTTGKTVSCVLHLVMSFQIGYNEHRERVYSIAVK